MRRFEEVGTSHAYEWSRRQETELRASLTSTDTLDVTCPI